MTTTAKITTSDLLKKVPAAVRPTVGAARRMVKAVAPKAEERISMSEPPRSSTYMWKIFRYAAGDLDVVGIGTFPKYSTLIFYRGRELDDGSGLLQGGGKDARFIRLNSPADAKQAAVRQLVRKAFRLGR